MSEQQDIRVRLGHLVDELLEAVLSQGFVWDREWVVALLERAGLMIEEGPVCILTPLARECVDAFLAAERVAD